MVGARHLGCSLAVLLALSCGGRSERLTDDESSDGGASESSFGGTSGATATGGTSGQCTIDGRPYAHGETYTFVGTHGCGACTCDDGGVTCVTVHCPGTPRCDVLSSRYNQRLMGAAKTCDPNLDIVQCNIVLPWELPCGCPTLVNDDTYLRSWLTEWQMLGCADDIDCPLCPNFSRADCSAEGTCVDTF